MTVFEVKTEACLGFCSRKGDHFYFVDQNRNIIKLARNAETQALAEEGRLLVKDKDIHSLEIFRFANLIIEHTYLISNSRIFYLNETTPLMNGILDMEDMSRSIDQDVLEALNSQPSKQMSMKPFAVNDNTDSEDSVSDDVRGGRGNLTNSYRKCVHGPFRFRGSSQFLLIF